jgi:preprotein translocase subunit YajC
VHIKWKDAPAMGNFDLAASSSSGSGSYTFLIVIVVLFALLYFVMIRPQRNRQRQAQEMQRRVQPGQRVRTTAGMYATVVDADDQDVVLEVAPGVHIRFLRRAIMDTLPDEEQGEDGAPAGNPAAAAEEESAAAEPHPATGAASTEPAGTGTAGTGSAAAAEASADGQLGTEHQNGAAPGSAATGPTARDERTAD